MRDAAFVSSVQAGPHMRWGKTATTVTVVLSSLVLLALAAPDLTTRILSRALQIVGLSAAVIYIILRVEFVRYHLLKALLKWRQWAYMPRSSITRFYLGIVGVLGGSKPKLWQLQPTLPALPVPPLKRTLDKYLESVQSLESESEFEQTVKAVREFSQPGGLGEKLQAMLEARAKSEPTSWLLEWWETLVYLSSRDPLPIYSNWYGLDRIDPVIRSQTGRAANLIAGLLKFKYLIDSHSLEPNRVQETIPLCMWQYSRAFGTVRVPQDPVDVLQTHNTSKHIVVICRDRYFRVDLYDPSGPLSARDIQIQLNRVVEIAEKEDKEGKKEPAVAVLTSENRTTWAHLRKDLIEMDESNKETIDSVEKSLFVLVLEEDAPETVEELSQYGMHRKGKSLWFDKNFNMIICANGRLLSNVDHTWGDASIMVHIFDYVFKVESNVDHWVQDPGQKSDLPAPKRLGWKVTGEIETAIATAQEKLNQSVQAIDLHVLKFQYFGKGLIKNLNMSPDAFCQMAIQLAYYRLHHEFVLTYESAATVRFHHGRTETVRSASNESAAFCRAMEDKNSNDAERLKLLQAAVKRHVRLMRAATNGDGIDRHLLGLRVLAAGTGQMPSIFTDKGYQLKFKLSTSQTPATSMLGGGFAPLCLDGYGLSYVVAEDRLWFHISTYRACPTTSTTKFAETLRTALLDLQEMCFANPAFQKVFSKRQFRIQRVD